MEQSKEQLDSLSQMTNLVGVDARGFPSLYVREDGRVVPKPLAYEGIRLVVNVEGLELPSGTRELVFEVDLTERLKWPLRSRKSESVQLLGELVARKEFRLASLDALLSRTWLVDFKHQYSEYLPTGTDHDSYMCPGATVVMTAREEPSKITHKFLLGTIVRMELLHPVSYPPLPR